MKPYARRRFAEPESLPFATAFEPKLERPILSWAERYGSMRQRNLPIKTWLALTVSISGVSFGCASKDSQASGATTSPAGASSETPAPNSSTPATPTPTNPAIPTNTAPAPSTNGTPGTSGSSSSNDTEGGGDTGATTTDETPGPAPDTSDDGPNGSDTPGPRPGGPRPGETDPADTSSDATTEPPADTDAPDPGNGTCTASAPTGDNASGTGPHDVVIETNSEDGIRCGTIFRPADLGTEKYPIFVWGEGGCSQNGLSNRAAMAEIASWGYFVVADGTPGGNNACAGGQSGAAFLDYITWAIAENDKPCSAYYQSLETTKIAADGFSCGGLMSENVAGDPRFTAIGITSSGLMGANNKLWDSMHAPFKIMNGGSSDIAYENGLNDYDAISSRGIPILYFSKTSAGHGGDLNQGRGDFNLVNLAWLNWQLKGDEGDTGKAFLIGPTCAYCDDGGWDFKSANIQ